MALLTPKDIREHTFQTVRFKEGYDVDEVDDFLDQVTETVEALGKQAVAGGQATQSLGPDVAGLNSKISELNAQIQSLQQENATLKSASEQAAGAGDQAAQAAQAAAAKLSEAEESNRALSSQNEQLKGQIDRLSAQVDQLTAQAAEAAGQADLGEQLTAVQHERAVTVTRPVRERILLRRGQKCRGRDRSRALAALGQIGCTPQKIFLHCPHFPFRSRMAASSCCATCASSCRNSRALMRSTPARSAVSWMSASDVTTRTESFFPISSASFSI